MTAPDRQGKKVPFRVFEVGPRDGLQNESKILNYRTKISFIRGLEAAGIRDLELGAFVRPDRVPQMADSDRIFRAMTSERAQGGERSRYWALVPNRRGLERALASGATEIALFTAATESFCQRNMGMSIAQSLSEIQEVIASFRAFRGARPLSVRGYVSTAFGCPFEGAVKPSQALKVIEALVQQGCDEVSIGDTIGVAGPASVAAVIGPAVRNFGVQRVAGHFHDTRGTALANALKSIDLGVRVIDSSAGGLGGCPFAPGATGNLATEDLVFMLEDLGFDTGIDLAKLCEVSLKLNQLMKRPLASRYLSGYVAAYGSGRARKRSPGKPRKTKKSRR